MEITRFFRIAFFVFGIASLCDCDVAFSRNLGAYVGRTVRTTQQFKQVAGEVSYLTNLDKINKLSTTQKWIKDESSKNRFANSVYKVAPQIFGMECASDNETVIREFIGRVAPQQWGRSHFTTFLLWNTISRIRNGSVVRDGTEVEQTVRTIMALSQEEKLTFSYHGEREAGMLRASVCDAKIYMKALGFYDLAEGFNQVDPSVSMDFNNPDMIAPNVAGWFNGTNGQIFTLDEADRHTLLINNKKLRLPVNGLANAGLKCYLDASLQALHKSRKFRQFIDSMPMQFDESIPKEGIEKIPNISPILRQLFKEMDEGQVDYKQMKKYINSIQKELAKQVLLDEDQTPVMQKMDNQTAEIENSSSGSWAQAILDGKFEEKLGKEIKAYKEQQMERLKRQFTAQSPQKGKTKSQLEQSEDAVIAEAMQRSLMEQYGGEMGKAIEASKKSLEKTISLMPFYDHLPFIAQMGINSEQDALEFITLLLDAIRTEANLGGKCEEFDRLFLTKTKTNLSCECGKQSEKDEIAIYLSVLLTEYRSAEQLEEENKERAKSKLQPLKEGLYLRGTDVKGLIEATEQTEDLGDDANRWNCGTKNCTKQTSRKATITGMPEILVVHLGRFTAGMDKVLNKINYSEQLDLHGSQYRLASVIKHHGQTLHSGHYTADVLGPYGRWYSVSDSSVTGPYPFDVDKDAYMFVYEKID